jgi:Ca-activated chloride channel family protein
MLQFEHTDFLWGLLALLPFLALFVWALHKKKQAKKALGNAHLVQALMGNYSSIKYQIKVVCILVAIAASILALANLRKPATTKGNKSNGVDIIFALDVSKSMLSQDEKPTRLDKAKQLMYQLIEKMEGNNVGLVLFAGEAFLQMPLTQDLGASKMFISNANPDLVNTPGTVISDAITLSSASMNKQLPNTKVVVLITDGEDHDAKAVDAAKKAIANGVAIFTVGVGSTNGSPILEPGTNEYKRDANGQTVISKLNTELLQNIATAAHGSYYPLKEVGYTSNALFTDINKLEKKPISQAGGRVAYQSFYIWFLALAILLLVLEIFISEKGKQKLVTI